MRKLLALVLCLYSISFGNVAILNTFTSGELSPHLDSRLDFDKYASGCRTLENFINLPHGGALKRSGTQYISSTKSNGVARLAPFSVGVDQTYVMEIGDKYIRFYRDGIQLLTSSNTVLEVSTPYSSNDVFEIQMAQFADTVYMVHPEYPPYKLSRTSVAPTFSFDKIVWSFPPILDENKTSITITPSATSGSVTLTSSGSIFTTNHVNSDWVLRSVNTNNSTSLSLATSGTSTAIRVEGEWNLRTIGGGFAGKLKLQLSEDDGISWSDYRTYESAVGDLRNYDRDGTEDSQNTYYRLVMVINGSSAGTAYLKNEEPYLNGCVTITNYLSATQVQAVVKSPLGSTNPTEIWFEGAFSEERGYPRTVSFFENRLFFGGTKWLVNTIWASMTDDYENFKTGTYDDSSLRISINSDNIIEWLLARSQLFIGTLGDEWILSGGDSSTPLTPTSIRARKQTGFGSKDGMPAIIASDSIVYLQRQGRKLREFEYNLESDAYKSTDITLLAEHITKGGIIQIAEQQQPEPIIWCIRGDGKLIGLTFNKAQNVYGWHRHVTDGEFESVAVIPTDGEDRIYVIVKRDNGRFVEWFRPFDWGDDNDAWFVDSGLDFDGSSEITINSISIATNGTTTVYATNSFTNGNNVKILTASGMSNITKYVYTITNSTTSNFVLVLNGTIADGSVFGSFTGTGTIQRVQMVFTNVSHLAGQTVSVFADGGVQPDATVSTNGVLTISDYKNRVIAGLPYTSRLSPMYIEVMNAQTISYGKTKNPYKVLFRVNNSGTFNYGSSTNSLYPVSVRKDNLPTGSSVPFYSGDLGSKPIDTQASTSPEFWITSDKPLPLELLSLTIFTDIKEYQ